MDPHPRHGDRAARDDPPPRRPVVAVGLLVLAAAAVVPFAGALDHGLLGFDDAELVGPDADSRYRSLSSEDVGWMFSTFRMGHYQPLTWLSYAADHQVSGDAPRGFHRTTSSCTRGTRCWSRRWRTASSSPRDAGAAPRGWVRRAARCSGRSTHCASSRSRG